MREDDVCEWDMIMSSLAHGVCDIDARQRVRAAVAMLECGLSA